MLGVDREFGGQVSQPGVDGQSKRRSLDIWVARLRRACGGDWARVVLAASVVAGIMSLSGGFGARAAPLAARLAYGEAMVLTGVGLGFVGSRLIIPRRWFETRRLLSAALMTLVVGLPMTLVSMLAAGAMPGDPADRPGLLDVLPTTLATTGGITVLAFLVRSREAVETREAPRGAPPARFLSRLPARLAGARLLAVEAQDHYLRLHTDRGDDLVLMRLADASILVGGARRGARRRTGRGPRHPDPVRRP